MGSSGRRYGAAAALVAAALTLGACGSGDESGEQTSAGGPAGAGGSTLSIENFVFKPETLQVAPGTRVDVRNKDGVVHTVTADDKSFDTGDVNGGQSGSVTVPKAGRFPFKCSIHTYMRGVIQAGP